MKEVKVVQKKKLIDALCESNMKTTVKKQISSENVHSASL